MKYKQLKGGSLLLTDPDTGEVKTIALATEKQMGYIRSLEKELGLEPKQYKDLTIWRATKVIDRLKKQNKNMRLL